MTVMSEVISIKRADWVRLEERARRLAREKSSLQLVNHLMNCLSEVPGLERTTEAIVRVILDNLGGANVALYYVIGVQTHYMDAYGERRLIATVEDGLVRQAFAERVLVEELRDFADTKMATPEFTKAAYWALPLIAGEQLVGVLKMEGMLLAAIEVRQQLQPFFNYAALILKNEIESLLKLTETSQLAAIVQSSEDAIIGKTLEGIITSWNRGAEHIYGYTEREVVGRSIALLAPPGRENEVPQILTRLTEGTLVERFETLRRRKDGQLIHMSLTISPIRNAAGKIVGASTIARDITEKKRVEDALRRLNRELRAISDCNQTLLRAVDEQSLLNDICRIVCDQAGYRMAWVGYAESDEARTVRPVAWAGSEDGYLAAANISWADTERGRGPTGCAIRTGRSACIQDFAADPAVALWRESAERRGLRSSIALPLLDGGGVPFGALSIYSAEPNTFTADEVRLLEELAGDLAYGINALRMRAEHKRTEVALRESERKYRVVADNTYDWEFWTDPAGRFLYSSPSCLRVTGRTQEEFLADPTTLARIIHPEDRALFAEHEREIHGGTHPGEIDFRVLLPDGTKRWISHVSQAVVDEQGVLLGRRGSNRDITEREQTEATREALLTLEARLSEASTPVEAARTIFATADQLWDWDSGALDLYSPEEDRADSVLSVDMIGGQRREVPSAIVSGVPSPRMRRVLRDGPELILRAPPIERPTDSVMFGDTGRPSASIMCVPLRQQGQPVGVLSVQSYTLHAFTSNDLRTLQGLADHWGGTLERIRAAAALRKSEARYRELILHQGEGLGIVDPQERFTFANPAGEAIFGVPNGGLVGRSLREFTTDAEYARLLAETEKRRAGEKSTYELELIRPDGEIRCLWVSSVPQSDGAGGFAGTLGLFLDITERKRAEASLLKLNQELDQRVRERTAELEVKNKELERMNKLFIGRELRMIELKARVRALEQQLPPAAPEIRSPQ